MRRQIGLLALVATLWPLASPGIATARTIAAGVRTNCLPNTPLACPSDLRTSAQGGPAIRGYVDRTSGLFIRIVRAFEGRVTQDEGCSSPTPQYQLYLHILIRNTRRSAVTFDLVNLTVRDARGRTYNPFGWGGPYPSHATPLAAGRSREPWIPYYIAKPASFSVWWRYISTSNAGWPAVIARFRVKPTGVKACGR